MASPSSTRTTPSLLCIALFESDTPYLQSTQLSLLCVRHRLVSCKALILMLHCPIVWTIWSTFQISPLTDWQATLLVLKYQPMNAHSKCQFAKLIISLLLVHKHLSPVSCVQIFSRERSLSDMHRAPSLSPSHMRTHTCAYTHQALKWYSPLLIITDICASTNITIIPWNSSTPYEDSWWLACHTIIWNLVQRSYTHW